MSRLAFVALLAAVTATASAARAQRLRRFAIVAGNDTGGGDTRSLLYAGADARKVYDILTRLGGVRTEDADAAASARTRVAAARRAGRASRCRRAEAKQRGERTALFFYYSGHAKDGALRLGETRLPIEALKARIARVAGRRAHRASSTRAARARSTRTKGARKAPAFEIQSDGPRDAKGLVILTSSTSDEDSQESDAIGGSYFSHHLASGLLGGADRSGDGRVTLFEAYAYAYDRTVADTAESAAGAQHPTFSYDLAGNGDLVLTDVAVRHEGVYLPREAPERGLLPGGRQGLRRRRDQQGGRRRPARRAGARPLPRQAPAARPPARRRARRPARPDGRARRGAPARRAVLRRSGQGRRARRPGVALVAGRGRHLPVRLRTRRAAPACSRRPACWRVDLSLRNFFRRDWVLGRRPRGRRRPTASSPAVGAPFKFSEVSLASSLTVEWPGRYVTPFVGGRLAMLLMSAHVHRRPRLPGAVLLDAVARASWAAPRFRIMAHTSLVARGRLHYLLYNVDENRSLGYWELAAMVSYDL